MHLIDQRMYSMFRCTSCISHVFKWWLVIVNKLFYNHTFSIIINYCCAVVVKNCVQCRVSDSISLKCPLPLFLTRIYMHTLLMCYDVVLPVNLSEINTMQLQHLHLVTPEPSRTDIVFYINV